MTARYVPIVRIGGRLHRVVLEPVVSIGAPGGAQLIEGPGPEHVVEVDSVLEAEGIAYRIAEFLLKPSAGDMCKVIGAFRVQGEVERAVQGEVDRIAKDVAPDLEPPTFRVSDLVVRETEQVFDIHTDGDVVPFKYAGSADINISLRDTACPLCGELPPGNCPRGCP